MAWGEVQKDKNETKNETSYSRDEIAERLA